MIPIRRLFRPNPRVRANKIQSLSTNTDIFYAKKPT
jgi:hypothetical protein